MQTNQKVRKDARDIRRHQQDNAIVPPFAGEESLHRPSRLPQPAILAMDREDMPAETIFALAEEVHEGGVFSQKRRVLVGRGLRLGVLHCVLVGSYGGS